MSDERLRELVGMGMTVRQIMAIERFKSAWWVNKRLRDVGLRARHPGCGCVRNKESV